MNAITDKALGIRRNPGDSAPMAAARGSWHQGAWDRGDTCRWRGVVLVCGTSHFAGGKAEHPWDPGWGWPEKRAERLWRPLHMKGLIWLQIVGRGVRGSGVGRSA